MSHPLAYFIEKPDRHGVYDADTIRRWEQNWFAISSSYALMRQVAYLMACQIKNHLRTLGIHHGRVVAVCGVGNNGGDGYLVAYHLHQMGFDVNVFAPKLPISDDCQRARQQAHQVAMCEMDGLRRADVVIDGLFGIGLDRALSDDDVALIHAINERPHKIALDVPSGLSGSGYPLPVAVMADLTLCVIAPKVALLTGRGRTYAGQILPITVLPPDETCLPVAVLDTLPINIPTRQSHAHKGDFGHVHVIGGHPNMGGAVMMAGESAMAVGAGKVSVVCHQRHHSAILSRSPNVMVSDIDVWEVADLGRADVVAFGMGLGRDAWAKAQFLKFGTWLKQSPNTPTILDADGLYWLAEFPQKLSHHIICTPHSAEAGRLLGVSADEVEQDRLGAIHELQANHGGSWVLKGAGTLSLERGTLAVCPYGNPKMATAGMGDVLSGVIAGLKAQGVSLSDCVKLHAKAGDELAKGGQVMAHQMAGVLAGLLGEITTPQGQHLSQNARP